MRHEPSETPAPAVDRHPDMLAVCPACLPEHECDPPTLFRYDGGDMPLDQPMYCPQCDDYWWFTWTKLSATVTKTTQRRKR